MNPTVQVKPLVWTALTEPSYHLVYHTADVGLGRYYQIVETPDGYVKTFTLWTEAKDMSDPPCGTVNGTGYSTLEAAQAAAQAEWDSFIQSAIEPIPYDTRN